MQEMIIDTQALFGESEEITETKTRIDLFIKEQGLKRFYKTKVEREEEIQKLIIDENERALELEKKLDGCFFIQTHDKELTTKNIVSSY